MRISSVTTSAVFLVAGSAAALGLGTLGACGTDDEAAAVVAADASVERVAATTWPLADAPVRDAADAAARDAARPDGGACNVRIDAIPIAPSPHVGDGTAIVYTSNPPSSGPHYGSWANFQELTHPVDDGYLVHSMEHGAVVLFYQCPNGPGADCDALVAELRAVRDGIPTDPSCEPAVRVRVVVAPRAATGVTVAAAAWGHIYRADCVDDASLKTFVLDHYAKGPEDICVAGQVF